MHRHFHIRKRTTHNLEPFPALTTWKRFLDKGVYAAGVLGPIMMLPQLWLIYIDHNAAGVSIVTAASLALLNIPWILYGIAHKERPIIITFCAWIVVNSLVAIGAMIFG